MPEPSDQPVLTKRSRLRLQCSVCHQAYSKREHLLRHERTHTGYRPFACGECGRKFARHDAMKRHAKLHIRCENVSGNLTPQGTSAPPLDLNCGSVDDHSALPSPVDAEAYGLHQPTEKGAVAPQNWEETVVLDSNAQLFWPDSEDLLQSIISYDPSFWAQASTYAPFLHGPLTPLVGNGAAAIPPLIPDSRTDSGQSAVQQLSGLIATAFTDITTAVDLSDLTSSFLDGCLHMFFTQVNCVFPIIHRPTFVFRECSAPLLLNAIALGSLFLGGKDAILKGEALWRLSHAAIATSWHTLIGHKGPYDKCGGVQLVLTALLSQVYAIFSRDKTIRMTSQIFHGLGFYWARHCGMFELAKMPKLPVDGSNSEHEQQIWRFWAARETQLRALLGMYIMDGIVAQFSGNPTFASHMGNPLPLPGSEAAFEATTASEWVQQTRASVPHNPKLSYCNVFRGLFGYENSVPSELSLPSCLSLRAALEGIASLVLESRRGYAAPPVGCPGTREIYLALLRLRGCIINNPSLNPVDSLSLLLRWHTNALSISADTARGTRRLCHLLGIQQHIFGGSPRHEDDLDPGGWVASPNARQALLHAVEMQKIVEELPRGRCHGFEVPVGVFCIASLYAAHVRAGVVTVVLPSVVDWEVAGLAISDLSSRDLDHVFVDRVLREGDTAKRETVEFVAGRFHGGLAAGIGTSTMTVHTKNLSYELSALLILLRGLSAQWGVAGEMERVLSMWIAKCG
ncbi:hypothetical protein P152DRAFT_412867 [Eremomyces bilateralis CBS 781.70]|uniref:C2H2-type domain-containing protein n=1 Tax=Eremomyces bilateralis CBS 781.70 TaxID=1392243 RepID=A0A6G1G8J2_9PEZI|nr:uncharacterized protein P152DRAFT_412867 [Eremomyces bilateralis CBS 781.70]KAF1814246.1 hypothetical protein P152DRAFT_412867 [Eremomyces bilateralis CBS 781.70]